MYYLFSFLYLKKFAPLMLEIVITILLVILFIYLFTREDCGCEKFAHDAISQLKKIGEKVEEVSEEEIHRLIDEGKVVMVSVKNEVKDIAAKIRAKGESNPDSFQFSHPVNHRLWPQYYYSFPYQYENGEGAWPDGMQSRLRNWQPGFETSGWSYWLRPGMEYKRWPRNRWVRNNDRYYFINNRE